MYHLDDKTGGKDKIEAPRNEVAMVPDTPVQKVASLVESAHNRVEHNLGASLSEGTSFNDTAYAPLEQKSRRPSARREERSDVLADVENQLRDIKSLADQLGQKGMEHRVRDIYDIVPIVRNVRSHKLATREGEIIDQIQSAVLTLQMTLSRHGIDLNTLELQKLAYGLGKPQGITKALGTIFPFWRSKHRGFRAPRFEGLSREASNLRLSASSERRRSIAA